MKRIQNFVLIFTVLFVSNIYSQVGIGTSNPEKSAALDISSSNSGILIPRVNLTSTTDIVTIPNPANSLLVYNLRTVNDLTQGFYYWQNNSWIPLKTEATVGSGWGLSGNTLLTGNEYIGTNNYYPLLFKVNNQQVARIHPNGGIALGQGAAANDNNSIAIGKSSSALTSNQAIAIGESSNASGFQATAIGYQSKSTNNSSVAIGMSASSSGYQSIGIGVNTVSNTNNSLSVGNSSKATGQQATAIGTEANASGQNALALGYQATATQANSIILGSSLNANNKVGIGTNTPDERLHIAGSIKIVDGTQGANKVLMSDANGKASWVNPSAVKAYADVYYSGSGQTIANNTNVTFGTTNVSSNMTVNNNNIQVLTTGKYKITYRVTLLKSDGGTTFVNYNLFKGSTLIPGSLAVMTLKKNEQISISGTVITTLNAYDQVSVRGTLTDSDVTLIANGCNLIVELVD